MHPGTRKLARLFSNLALVAGITLCGHAYAEIINIEEAIEAYDVLVSMDSSGKGRVYVRECTDCKTVTLEITPETAIFLDGNPAKAGDPVDRHWLGGIVIYNVAEKRVVRLDL